MRRIGRTIINIPKRLQRALLPGSIVRPIQRTFANQSGQNARLSSTNTYDRNALHERWERELNKKVTLGEIKFTENIANVVDPIRNFLESEAKAFTGKPFDLATHLQNPENKMRVARIIVSAKNKFHGLYSRNTNNARDPAATAPNIREGETTDHKIPVSDATLKLIIHCLSEGRICTLEEYKIYRKCLNDKSLLRSLPADIHSIFTALERHTEKGYVDLLSLEEKINLYLSDPEKQPLIFTLAIFLKQRYGETNLQKIQNAACDVFSNLIKTKNTIQSPWLNSYADNFTDFYKNNRLKAPKKVTKGQTGGNFDLVQRNYYAFIVTLLGKKVDEPDILDISEEKVEIISDEEGYEALVEMVSTLQTLFHDIRQIQIEDKIEANIASGSVTIQKKHTLMGGKTRKKRR